MKQAFEQQIGIDDDIVVAMGNNGFSHTACSNDMRLYTKSWQKHVDKTVYHGSRTIENAALHALKSIAPNKVSWFFDGDGRQLRGTRTEGTKGSLNTRNNESATEAPVFVDYANGGGCTKINDDSGCALTTNGS